MSNSTNYLSLSVPRTFELSIGRPALTCHSKIESTVRDLDIDVEDAIELAEKIEILRYAIPRIADMVGGEKIVAVLHAPTSAIGILVAHPMQKYRTKWPTMSVRV